MSILTVAAGTVSSPLPVLAGSRKHMHPGLGTPGRNCCRGKLSRGFGNPVHTRLTSVCIQNLICQVRADWRRLSPPPSCLGYSHTSSRPGFLGVTLPDMVIQVLILGALGGMLTRVNDWNETIYQVLPARMHSQCVDPSRW